MSNHGCGDPSECPSCQLSAALAKVAELSIVALEAAAMLSETNHGGLTHLRSVSMQMALEAAGVSIPPSCSACPHPARDGLAAKVVELEKQLRWSQEHEEDLIQENDNLRASARTALGENARLRREVEAINVCWHCKVCLLPTKPRCETCPDECDDEACSDEGCLEERAKEAKDG